MVWKCCPSASLSLVIALLCSGCDMMETVVKKTDTVITKLTPDPEPRIKRAWAAAAPSCASATTPDITLADPTCVSLVTRGREMECVAARITQEGLINRFASRDGLLNWEVCVKQVARILSDGYYLGAREIERRLQLCDVALEATASEPPQGAVSRLFYSGSGAPTARPIPADYGVAGAQLPVGLLKCEVMLPKKALPVEVRPVVGESVVESASEKPGAGEPLPSVKPTGKKRVKRAATKPEKGVVQKEKKPVKPAVGGGQPDNANEGRARGKQT